MQPIAPLMIEHRLIERMITLMRRELERVRANILVDPEFAFVDPVFIDTAVDFMRTYGDHCHHGKEENLLFAELAKKELAPDLKKILDELTEEHKLAREYTKELVKAKEDYLREEPEAVNQILFYLDKLTAMYPSHILKEDQHFFISVMNYFTPEEKAAMLARMWEFDRQLIHEKYGGTVAAIETRGACGLKHKHDWLQSPGGLSRLTRMPAVNRSGGSWSLTRATRPAKVKAQSAVWSWPVSRWASSWHSVARRRPGG